MKRNALSSLWLIIIVLLTVTACERPVPRSDTPTPLPTTEAPLVQPTAPTPIVQMTATSEGTSPDGELGEATPDGTGPTATPVPAATDVATGQQIHIVQSGDTLFRIAVQYGVTVEEIAAANGLTNVDVLEVGQQLLIPAPGTVDTSTPVAQATSTPPPVTDGGAAGGTHVVQAGENLFRIGLRYGCTVQQMARANNIANPNRISVGQVLRIPDCN